MADPLAIAGLAISGAGLLGNIFGQLNAPDFPVSEDDLNKIFDIRLNRGLSDIASGARRRLVGAGQEGSGTIESVIGDLQNRFREQLEGQRESALQDLRLAEFGADTQASERLSNILGGATALGANLFSLSDTGQSLLNPFGDSLNSGQNDLNTLNTGINQQLSNVFNQVTPGQGGMEFNKFQLGGAGPFGFGGGIGDFRSGIGGK